ncbi:MAG TPA: alternate-type signal peptide domain-containing protein [Actinomycetaceae bacterium]|nr:alternate-type signal peptide domain-containing protein [Actinomycetaceae bacterium]
MSKKMMKGTIAITAGVVLLLGGAGTYALWEVTQPLDGTVASGDLNLELGAASWTLNGEDVAGVEDVRIVPGDTLVLAQQLTVTAIGDDLAAQLAVDTTEMSGNSALVQQLEVSLALPDPTWADATEDGAYTIAPADEAYEPVTATVTIVFDEETGGQIGTNGEVDLSGVVFSLNQVPSS